MGRHPALGWAVRLVISAAILYLIFTLVPVDRVARILAGVDPAWLVLATAVFLLEQIAVAWRIRVLTDQNGMPLSGRSILGINAIGAFYSVFLPGELVSSAVRWYRMSQPSGQRAEAFAAIGFARLVDTLGLLALGALFWLIDLPTTDVTVFYVLLAGFGSLLLLLVLSLHQPLHRRFLGLLRALPQVRPATVAINALRKVMDAVTAYRGLSPGAISALVLWTFARHILSAVSMAFCMIAIGLSVDWLAVVWIKMVVSFVTMLPITLAGLGVREGTLALLLAPHGVDGAEAVALGFLLLFLRLLFAAGGGLLEGRRLFHSAAPNAAVEGKR